MILCSSPATKPRPCQRPWTSATSVNSALDRVRRRAHGLVFDVELNPFYVIGDSDTLERAVTNLLDNAVKWSPRGGTIRVQLEGDRLRVADQGPGIAEADMPFIFDRFYRGDTARQTPGLGWASRSLPKRSLTMEAGSVQVARPRAGRSSLSSCRVRPASRSLTQPTKPSGSAHSAPTPPPPASPTGSSIGSPLAESGRKRQS